MYDKSFLVILFTFFLFPLLAQCQVSGKGYSFMLKNLLSHTVPEISVKQAVAKKSQAVFLDAREKKEFEVSSIKGARYVGYDHFDFKSLDGIDKNTEIIVYCSVGYRSEKVSEKLIAKGFKNVSNLYGGIFEWVNEGNPVYKNGKKTSRVHAYDRKWGVWLKKGEKVY